MGETLLKPLRAVSPDPPRLAPPARAASPGRLPPPGPPRLAPPARRTRNACPCFTQRLQLLGAGR
eukprot:10774906-Alexandrium_andersonii.AAC.1